MATTGERLKEVEAEAASADSIFQQLYSLRAAYDEYSKFKEEAIPQAEAELANLNEELDQKTQALDDVIFWTSVFWTCVLLSSSNNISCVCVCVCHCACEIYSRHLSTK